MLYSRLSKRPSLALLDSLLQEVCIPQTSRRQQSAFSSGLKGACYVNDNLSYEGQCEYGLVCDLMESKSSYVSFVRLHVVLLQHDEIPISL